MFQFAAIPSSTDTPSKKITDPAMSKEIMSKLEEELHREFEGAKEDGIRKHTEKVKKKQALFVKEVITEVKTDDHIFSRKRHCAVSYMINRGEMAILQKRINRLREMRKVFSDCRDVLRDMVVFYDHTIDYLMKYIAKAIGYASTNDVIDRVIALRFIKAESMAEQEKLSDAHSRMNEQHLFIKNTLGKRNLLLNNERSELDVGLQEKVLMVKELGKGLQEAMTSSCDSTRLLFQISNQINGIHDSVTNARGYTSQAKTVFEKLSEINERMTLLAQALKAAIEKTHGAKHKKRSIRSDSNHNYNRNVNSLTPKDVSRYVFNAYTNTTSTSTSNAGKPGKKSASTRTRSGSAARGVKAREATSASAIGRTLMASANSSEQWESFVYRSANDTNPAASPFTEESTTGYDDRYTSRRRGTRNENFISVNGNSGCGNGFVCPEILKTGGTFHPRQGKSSKAQTALTNSSDKNIMAMCGEFTDLSCSRRTQGITYSQGSQGSPASPINIVARKNEVPRLPTIV